MSCNTENNAYIDEINNLHGIFKVLDGNTAFLASNIAHLTESTKYNAAEIIYLQG